MCAAEMSKIFQQYFSVLETKLCGKFVRDLRQVGCILRVLRTVSSTNKTDRHVQYNWNIAKSGVKHHKRNVHDKTESL